MIGQLLKTLTETGIYPQTNGGELILCGNVNRLIPAMQTALREHEPELLAVCRLFAALDAGELPQTYCFLGRDADGGRWEYDNFAECVRYAREADDENADFRITLCLRAWEGMQRQTR